MNSDKQADYRCSLILLILVYVFLFFLNVIFPRQSDDLGISLGGIQAAVNSYNTWNARLGELLLVSFGSYLSASFYFAFINAFIGTGVVLLSFVLLFGRLPQKTFTDIASFLILFTFFMFDPVFCFGSVFYWGAGTFNYLWGWFFILLFLAPYSLFWRNKTFSPKTSLLFAIGEIPLGIAAGWSSEFCIVFIFLACVSFIYLLAKKAKIPLWYITGLLAFTIGWVILFSSPGLRVRGQHYGDDTYMSLSRLMSLNLFDLLKWISNTFNRTDMVVYYENFCYISIFLFLVAAFCRNLKMSRVKGFGLVILMIGLMFLSLRLLPRLCFLFLALFICLSCVAWLRKENQLEARLFWAIIEVLFVESIFIGATILVEIPRRASFQYTLSNASLILICMTYYFQMSSGKKKLLSLGFIGCLSFSLIFSVFVGFECMDMHNKWVSMVADIENEKQKGNTAVVVDKNTFISRYWNYGDWGNISDNPDSWPNDVYAAYFGLKSIRAE